MPRPTPPKYRTTNWPGSTFDLTRTEEDTGYSPAYSIEQAMEGYADWLRQGHEF